LSTATEETLKQASGDVVLESTINEMRRYRRRGVALLLGGVLMPILCGVVASGMAATFLTMPRGMENYVPLFMGAAFGLLVGLMMWLFGIGAFLHAMRIRRGLAANKSGL
jgi:hypothetical protein